MRVAIGSDHAGFELKETIKAFLAGKQGEVTVVGFDGIPEALAAIRRGSMTATVAQYPYTMGQLAIQACLAALRI